MLSVFQDRESEEFYRHLAARVPKDIIFEAPSLVRRAVHEGKIRKSRGALAGKRRGRGLLINNGSFYDWLGDPVPVCPERGTGYDVLPDDETQRVERLKKERLRALEVLSRSPASPILEALEEGMGHRVTERQERWDEAMAALREQLREGVPWCWREVRAVETVLDEVAAEFDGEDPLLPPVRGVLDKTRQDLADLHLLLGFVDAEVELPEPDEERVEFLRQRWLRQDT